MILEEAVRKSWNMEGSGRSPAPFSLLLCLFSLPYGVAVTLRNRLYDRGLLRQERLPCPVISVGNLTVGGTGKTPTVILLAKLLREKGRRPAVLSRGYGGRAKGPVNTVSDGKDLLMGWREAGDEPALIARSVPGVPVLTGARRLLTGQAAIGRYGADILILDDAFQHRALHRDADIVLVHAARPFGNGRLLPREPLREPLSALARAHLLIRTGGPSSPEDEPSLPEIPAMPVFRGIRRPLGVVAGESGCLLPAASLQGEKVCAFAGIGRPEAFRASLAELGSDVVAFCPFPDHHPYSRRDLEALRRAAAGAGARRIVTTEKDFVRLSAFPDFQKEVSSLRIGMEITPAEEFTEVLFPLLRQEG